MNIRRPRRRSQFLERGSEFLRMSFRDSTLPLVLDHNSAFRSFNPTIPFDRPVNLSVWKNSKNNFPPAPSGIWAGKNSPKYLRFCAAREIEKHRSNFSTSTPFMAIQLWNHYSHYNNGVLSLEHVTN
jgi:hypothetical protein